MDEIAYSCKDGSLELGSPKVGFLELGIHKVGSLELGLHKVDSLELGSPKDGFLEIRVTQIKALTRDYSVFTGFWYGSRGAHKRQD